MQSLWNFAGKKFFPAWHAQLPNLLNPEPRSRFQTPLTNRKSEIGNRKWNGCASVICVIVSRSSARWIYLASGVIGLSEDEAYQWLWSKHLALSYYSKPPGIAFIQWAGTVARSATRISACVFFRRCSPRF